MCGDCVRAKNDGAKDTDRGMKVSRIYPIVILSKLQILENDGFDAENTTYICEDEEEKSCTRNIETFFVLLRGKNPC